MKEHEKHSSVIPLPPKGGIDFHKKDGMQLLRDDYSHTISGEGLRGGIKEKVEAERAPCISTSAAATRAESITTRRAALN